MHTATPSNNTYRKVVLDEARLYELVKLDGPAVGKLLRIEFVSGGAAVFAFTFG